MAIVPGVSNALSPPRAPTSLIESGQLPGGATLLIPAEPSRNTVAWVSSDRILSVNPQRLTLMRATGQPIWTLERPDAQSRALAVIDAERFAVGAAEGRVQVRRLKDGGLIKEMQSGVAGWVSSIAVSSDQTEIVVGSGTGDMRRWRLADDAMLPLPAVLPITPQVRPTGGRGRVQGRRPLSTALFTRIEHLAFSADGTLAIAGKSEMTRGLIAVVVDRWATGGGKLRTIVSHRISTSGPDYGQTLAFSPDGKWLAVGTWGGGVFLYDRALKEQGNPPFLLESNFVNRLQWRPDSTGVWAQRPRSLVWMDTTGQTQIARRLSPVEALMKHADGTYAERFFWDIALSPKGHRMLVMVAPTDVPEATTAKPLRRR